MTDNETSLRAAIHGPAAEPAHSGQNHADHDHPNHDHSGHDHPGHGHEVQRIQEKTIDVVREQGRLGWGVRLFLAVGGVALLAGALAAWQMQDQFGGRLASALPWLIFGAVVLGVAAVVESITTEVWVTLIAGFFLILIAYVVTGRVNVQLDQQQHAAYIVDRFTGETRICSVEGCRDLAGFGGPSIALKMPKMDIRRAKASAPAPATK
ncbi:MAG: hypothetical protein KGJ75_17690 [Alphaproteobacteria bacterium]|nr:hypothetical protein [Alphaproteobacteria bacterium]MDE2014752.1 hypothetical protein [Alphaproteobacteria bacterium]MDE2073307.1 hypothetical protein [Alphaproteobacteria bacterium]